MTPASRRLPAYAKALLDKRRQGIAPSNGLRIALDWTGKHRGRTWRIVVPPDCDLENLDLSVAAGLECLLLGRNQDRMDEVARKLLELPLARLVGVSDHVTIYWPGPT